MSQEAYAPVHPLVAKKRKSREKKRLAKKGCKHRPAASKQEGPGQSSQRKNKKPRDSKGRWGN